MFISLLYLGCFLVDEGGDEGVVVMMMVMVVMDYINIYIYAVCTVEVLGPHFLIGLSSAFHHYWSSKQEFIHHPNGNTIFVKWWLISQGVCIYICIQTV